MMWYTRGDKDVFPSFYSFSTCIRIPFLSLFLVRLGRKENQYKQVNKKTHPNHVSYNIKNFLLRELPSSLSIRRDDS